MKSGWVQYLPPETMQSEAADFPEDTSFSHSL